MSNCYGMMSTELTTFVIWYSCNNITLKMATIVTEIYCENLMKKYIIKIEVHVVGYL